MHHSRVSQVVIDVPPDGHDAELASWHAAIGSPLAAMRHPEYHAAMLPGADVRLLVQRLDEGAPRVHLDIHTDDLDAEVRRLERVGARRVRQVHSWWVMRDPAGLLFCVIPVPPGGLDDTNARRWP
jgi:hypothetical protein